VLWLGPSRGFATDWTTQLWVKATGRRLHSGDAAWLDGPKAPTKGITPEFFEQTARSEGLNIQTGVANTGIIPELDLLESPNLHIREISAAVRHFYQHTACYELDAWAEWCGLFRPFGWLLAAFFSRRLQQLNVPLSALDTSHGLSSEVLQLIEPNSNTVRHTVWFRRLLRSGNVLYAGFYSVCVLPGRTDPCVKVVFPLPNGNAVVIMRAEVEPDGSLVLTSAGNHFGDPGFYFTVHAESGMRWARYVRAMRETIRVYATDEGHTRADHSLKFCGATFLRLHYRMRPRAEQL
jgi:hypothetical protein